VDKPDADEIIEQGCKSENGECGVGGTRFASLSVVFVVQIVFAHAEVASVIVVNLPDNTARH
jgi:hypothetical protein